MALASYSDLKSSITDWMARSDISTIADDCIDLAEADFNRMIRTRDMETNATLTLSSGEATLPSDYLAWRTVTSIGSPRIELEFVAPSFMEDTFPTRYSGYPRYFTIRGSTILVLPLSDDSVRLDYYEKIDSLDDTTTTNWLLTKYPNVYLFGSLKYAAAYIRDDASMQRFHSMTMAALEALSVDDNRSRFHRMTARISGPTP